MGEVLRHSGLASERIGRGRREHRRVVVERDLAMDGFEQRMQGGQSARLPSGDIEREGPKLVVCGRERRFTQVERSREAFDRAAHHAGAVMRLDLAFDADPQRLDRADGREHMADIAEGVLDGRQLDVLPHIDAPRHHVLTVMGARRQPERLDDRFRRRLVPVDRLLRYFDAHWTSLESSHRTVVRAAPGRLKPCIGDLTPDIARRPPSPGCCSR
jgi:hypothetical protein